MRTHRLPAFAAGLLLSGCATSTDYLEYRPKDRPQIVADRLLRAMKKCWFDEKDSRFSAYRLEPELSSHSNKPRLLLVRADEPGGLPKLIVEASRDNRRNSVKLFGPLLTTPLGPGIQADVKRWSAGASDCA